MNQDKKKDFKGSLLFQCTALVALSLLAPVVLRLALIIEKEIAFGRADLRGFITDLLISLLVATTLSLLLRLSIWLAVALTLLWSLVNYGSYELIMALDTLPDIANVGYLGDWTFLNGSVLTISSPIIFVIVLLCPALMISVFFRRRTAVRLRFAVPAILFCITLPVLLLWPVNHETLPWRQTHFIDDNFYMLTHGRASASAKKPTATVNNDFKRSLQANLAGKPAIKLAHKNRNVLLIVLESISGGYIDTISRDAGVKSSITMPKLNNIARQNIVYGRFFTNQRQTNRGEYAILCGDYPRLTTAEPKMSAYIHMGAKKTCLPELLKNAGYETLYLQAAPMAFMMKDQFMSKIGFSRLYGDDWFKDSYARAKWGIDDRAYFEQSIDMVRSLQSSEKPWFMTMMTVGTHHPYIVPKSYKSKREKGSFSRAVEYLDISLDLFLKRLKEEGLLKDTLVLITSDESVGLKNGSSDIQKILSQNWGLLIAILPNGEHMKINENFMQVDIALSILDYLGLDIKADQLYGRSVFRQYSDRRPIIFANTYQHLIGALDSSGLLHLCKGNFDICKKYRFDGPTIFSATSFDELPEDRQSNLISDLRAYDGSISKKEQGFDIKLAHEGLVDIQDDIEQVIFAGQAMEVSAGTRIEVDLEIEIAQGHGLVAFIHDFIARESAGGKLLFLNQYVSPPLAPGDVFGLKYSYYTANKALRNMDCMLHSKKISGGKLKLKIRRARISAHPMENQNETAVGLAQETITLNKASFTRPEMIKKTITLYEATLKTDPNNIFANIYLGYAYAVDGLYAKADKYFKIALRTAPLDPKTHQYVAEGYLLAGMKEQANYHWKRAATLKNR